MSISRYSEDLNDEIPNYKYTERTNVNYSVECAFCGHLCNSSRRKPSKTSSQALFDKYPNTIRYIFKKLNLQCKKVYNKCFNLLTKCIVAMPEDVFTKAIIDTFRHLQNQINQ
jgi:hypothetical protein